MINILLFNKYIHVIYMICILLIAINLTKRFTRLYAVKKNIEPHRKKVILNVFYIFYYSLFVFLLLLVLGIELKDVVVFASSILAVLGVGFFAQWSILSNLTASVILFFNHPIRIGDKIKILDKDFDLTGIVKNITGFYVVLFIEEGEREITIPTTVVLYKGVERIKKKQKTEESEIVE